MTDKNEAIRLLEAILRASEQTNAKLDALTAILTRQADTSRPTVAQVEDYARASGLAVYRVHAFLEWAESTGWTLGGEPIKSWRGAFKSYLQREPAEKPNTSLMDDDTRRELARATMIKQNRRHNGNAIDADSVSG